MTGRPARTVLYVTALPSAVGGISTWMRNLLQRGVPGGFTARFVDKSLGPGRHAFERPSLVSEAGRTLRILAVLLRELLFHRPALVHVNVSPLSVGLMRDAICADLARLLRVPVLAHYHGLFSEAAAAGRSRVLLRCLAHLARSARFNLVVNQPSREFLLRLSGAAPDRVVLLPNFLDETALPSGEPAPRDPAARPRVVFAAGLTRAKGAPLVIAAARAVPEADFHLLGRVYEEVRPELDPAPPNLVLHGEVEHEAMLEQLAAGQLLLFPSSSEGFPYVVLEAMALGLPVVATPVGALPEMVEDGKGGRLVEPTAPAIVAAIRELLADEPARLAMGRFNAEKARRQYSHAAVAGGLARLYEECS